MSDTSREVERRDADTDTENFDLVGVHGLDPRSGEPARPPKSWDELFDCVCSTFNVPGKEAAWLRKSRDLESLAEAQDEDGRGPDRGQPPPDVDPSDLASAGWGLLFHSEADPAFREALDPLIRHRQEQAGNRFRVFDGTDGFLSDDTFRKWLRAWRLSPYVPTDPDHVPYYLGIVGLPTEIPFDVDFGLAHQLAVGRLGFETPEQAAAYAQSVVDAETNPHRDRRWANVATAHDDDFATSGLPARGKWPPLEGSLKGLVEPILAKHGKTAGWRLDSALGPNATKSRLMEALRSQPSLLFTAGHGLGSGGPEGDPAKIGALVTADWPGPKKTERPIPEQQYFAAADLEAHSDLDLRGLVAVLFGCYTAGQPEHDTFCLKPPRRLGPEPRLSTLAQQLLGRQNGALAVLGHLDQAWTYSYRWRGLNQPQTFQAVFADLLKGMPVGYAVRHLGERYHLLAARSSEVFRSLSQDEEVDPRELVEIFMAEQDARGYMLLGDPAVQAGGWTGKG